MRRHRTTPRGILFLAALLGLAAATAAFAANKVPEHIIFPVVGQVSYVDDFGAPRPGGPHQGNDLMAAKKSPAVAAEAGKVKYWTTSRAAGCMLYLYGESGTTYYYIHLNNDRTMRNDNRGKCVKGTAYKLLFAAKPGTPFALTLTGTVVSASIDRLVVNVSTSQAWPSGLTLTKLNRPIAITVPETTVVQSLGPTGVMRAIANVSLAEKGQAVVVWTQPAPASLKAQRADDGALSSALIQ